MKNGNMPAMPQTNADNLCMQTGTSKIEHSGLTKREYFAGLAMQGLSANMEFMFNVCPQDRKPADYVAEQSLALADALLEELERTK